MWLLAPGAWGKRCMAYLSGDQRSQLGGSLCGGFYVGACPVIRLCTGLLFYFWNEIRAPRGDKWLVFWWKGDKWGCSVVTVGRGVVSRDWIKGSYQWSLLIGAICQWFSDQKTCTGCLIKWMKNKCYSAMCIERGFNEPFKFHCFFHPKI